MQQKLSFQNLKFAIVIIFYLASLLFSSTTVSGINYIADTSSHSYEPDNANILYVGRIDFTDPKKPIFSAPAVYIKTAFTGVSCSIKLEDEFLNNGKNYYEVIIDKKYIRRITPQPGQHVYLAMNGLKYGKHEVTFVKRTEAAIGKCTFLGFIFGGVISKPAPLSDRKIAFYGNSISVGSGNEGHADSPECKEWNLSIPYSNANLSFASLAAQRLKAEYQITGVSGIGMVRNYTSGNNLTMPMVYDHLHLADATSPKWSMNLFIPYVIVIELGTNDFSPGDNPTTSPRSRMDTSTFCRKYIHFVDTILSKYPNAHVFCMYSPMLTDGWPDASFHSYTDHVKSMHLVVNHFNEKGIKSVHQLPVSHQAGKGCTSHPSAAEHVAIASEVESEIKKVMGW